MKRLIEAYRKVPSPENRKKIEAHIQKHPFAPIMLMPEDQQFLKAHEFKF